MQGAPTRKTQAKTAAKKKKKKNALGSFTKEKKITLRLSDDSTNARDSILGHWCDTAPTTAAASRKKERERERERRKKDNLT